MATAGARCSNCPSRAFVQKPVGNSGERYPHRRRPVPMSDMGPGLRREGENAGGCGHKRRDCAAGSAAAVVGEPPDGPTELLPIREFPDGAVGVGRKSGSAFRHSSKPVRDKIAAIASYGAGRDGAREPGALRHSRCRCRQRGRRSLLITCKQAEQDAWGISGGLVWRFRGSAAHLAACRTSGAALRRRERSAEGFAADSLQRSAGTAGRCAHVIVCGKLGGRALS